MTRKILTMCVAVVATMGSINAQHWDLGGNSTSGGQTLGTNGSNASPLTILSAGDLNFQFWNHSTSSTTTLMTLSNADERIQINHLNFEVNGDQGSTGKKEDNTFRIGGGNLMAHTYGNVRFILPNTTTTQGEMYPFSGYHPSSAGSNHHRWKIPVSGITTDGTTLDIAGNRFGMAYGKIGVMGASAGFGKNFANVGVFGYADHLKTSASGGTNVICGGEFVGNLTHADNSVSGYGGDFSGYVYGVVGRANISDDTSEVDTSNVKLFGLYGEGTGTTMGGIDGGLVVGVYGNAVKGKQRYGGYFSLNGFNPIGNGAPTASWALFADGNTNIQGNIYQNGSLIHSDRNLKQNINRISNASDILNGLSGYSYQFKPEFQEKLGFSDKKHLGLMAQDVQAVMPEAVQESGNGHLAVNYDMVIPVLVEAFKEQSERIGQLESMLNNAGAEEVIISPKGNHGESSTSKQNMAQFQVLPNPNNGEFDIQYFISNEFANARIVIFDLNGKIISENSIDVQSGKLAISIQGLQSGCYVANFIVDGDILEMKKIVVTE